MKHQKALTLVLVSVQMFNTRCIEAGRATDDAMDNVAFAQQKLSQIAAILAGDACTLSE